MAWDTLVGCGLVVALTTAALAAVIYWPFPREVR